MGALSRVSDAEQAIINAIIKELSAARPDEKSIIEKLKSLQVPPAVQSNVRKIVSNAIKQLEVADKVKKILEEAKKKVAGGETIDAWLMNQFKDKNIALTAYQKEALSGAERTYASAYGVLINLIGKAALEKIVKLQQVDVPGSLSMAF